MLWYFPEWSIGHFRVPKNLAFKTRLRAKPLLWKWVLFASQFKKTFISMASHFESELFETRKWPITIDSQAQVIQVLKYCTQWETFQFALPAWNLFTQENESRAWSQLIAGQVFGKIRVLEKSSWNRCKSRLFRFHYSAWFLYFYKFPSMLRRLSSESFNKH